MNKDNIEVSISANVPDNEVSWTVEAQGQIRTVIDYIVVNGVFIPVERIDDGDGPIWPPGLSSFTEGTCLPRSSIPAQ